jgi:cytochrome c556
MQRTKAFGRRIRLAATAVGSLTIVGSTAYLHAQAGQGIPPQETLVEVMASRVMPLAQILWDAVVYEDTIKGPETDEGWQKVRAAAASLAETSDALLIPDRPVAAPGKTPGEGELSPQEIQALIAKNHDAWIGFARGLHEVAAQAIHAVDTKSVDELSDVAGTLDSVCEGCHQQFWYPNQR